MTQYQIISNDPGGPTIIRQMVSPRSQALLTPRHRPPPTVLLVPRLPPLVATYWPYPTPLLTQRNGGKSHHRWSR